jgi:hypothetical protein
VTTPTWFARGGRVGTWLSAATLLAPPTLGRSAIALGLPTYTDATGLAWATIAYPPRVPGMFWPCDTHWDTIAPAPPSTMAAVQYACPLVMACAAANATLAANTTACLGCSA